MQWTEERMQHAAGWAKAVQKGYRANKSTENQSSLTWHQCCGSWCKHSSPIQPLGCLWHQMWTQRKGFQPPLPNSKQHALMRSLGCIRGALLKSSPRLSSPTHHALVMAQLALEHTNPFGNQRMYSRDAHGAPQSLASPGACTRGNPEFCSHCTKVTQAHPRLELLYQGFSRGQFT